MPEQEARWKGTKYGAVNDTAPLNIANWHRMPVPQQVARWKGVEAVVQAMTSFPDEIRVQVPPPLPLARRPTTTNY